jgi:hypothetical protein
MSASEWLSYDDSDAGGKPVVVDFDARFDDASERGANDYRIAVTVSGFSTDADGLPDDAAEDELYDVGQRIESALGERGVLAFSLAGSSAFAWHAYASDSSLTPALEKAARADGLDVSSSGTNDPQWSEYERYALTGEDLEQARDCEQLEELTEAGDDLRAEHDISFDYEFPSHEAAVAAQHALAAAGMPATDLFGDVIAEDSGVDTIVRRLVPTPEAISRERARLNAIVVPCGGTYAGWGTEQVDGDDDAS